MKIHIYFYGAVPLVGLGLLTLEISRSHSDTPHSVETLYLTTHNTHNRRRSVPQRDSNPAIPASERPQAKALYRAATGIGIYIYIYIYIYTHTHTHTHTHTQLPGVNVRTLKHLVFQIAREAQTVRKIFHQTSCTVCTDGCVPLMSQESV